MFAVILIGLMVAAPGFVNADGVDKPFAVFCHAVWCEPCKRMQKEMAKVTNMDLVDYRDIDIDEEPELAGKLMEGRTVPQLIMYFKVDGKMRKNVHYGFKTAKQIEAIFHDAHVQSVRQVH